MRRLAAALLLATLALGTPLAVVPADAAGTGVTWRIDHGEKTITATIRITLTPVCSNNARLMQAMSGTQLCRVPAEAAARIKEAIERLWNNGNRYYCYDIVVHVDITVDNNPTSTPADRLMVQVDQTPVPVRSFVVGMRNGTPQPGGTGSTPSDEFVATNSGSRWSTWSYPPRSPQTYAHEAGHILGLDDGYEDVHDADGNHIGSQIRAGHADDLMSNNTRRGHLDKSTLRRMVERQGYKKTDLQCNYRIDQASFGGRITGKKCDPLGGFWRPHGTYSVGRADGTQDWAISIDETTKRGTYSYTDNQIADFVPGIVVITEGKAFGDASITIDDELWVHMHLVEQWHTYRSSANGGPWGHDQNAPTISLDFVWEAIGKCPP
jgi:hypothetical protein